MIFQLDNRRTIQISHYTLFPIYPIIQDVSLYSSRDVFSSLLSTLENGLERFKDLINFRANVTHAEIETT